MLLFCLCYLSCKKKEGELPSPVAPIVNTTLLDGSVDYNGAFPSLNTIDFIEDGQNISLQGYPGQVLIFFNSSVIESDALGIIQANGGTVLAKFPVVGYYMVNTTIGSEGSFITAVVQNPKVFDALPNSFGIPGCTAKVTLLEGCQSNDQHFIKVKNALENNGGTFDECRDIYNGNASENVFHKIVVSILSEANQNNGGTTLINLSTYGTSWHPAGGYVNGSNFNNFADDVKTRLKNAWYIFMKVTLNAIAALPPEKRENLVLTVCAGNNNMPICDLIDKLRLTSKYAEILKNNILIVSTTSMQGNNCNTDSDEANNNNAEANQGTSYASPGALAVIQKIICTKNISAHDALRAVKLAVEFNPNHELIESEAQAMADAIKAGNEIWTGTYTLTTNISSFCTNITTLNNSGKVTMVISTNSSYTGKVNMTDMQTWYDALGNYNCTLIPLPSSSGPITGLRYASTFSGHLEVGHYQGINILDFDGTRSGNTMTGTLSYDGTGTFSVTKQ